MPRLYVTLNKSPLMSGLIMKRSLMLWAIPAGSLYTHGFMYGETPWTEKERGVGDKGVPSLEDFILE